MSPSHKFVEFSSSVIKYFILVEEDLKGSSGEKLILLVPMGMVPSVRQMHAHKQVLRICVDQIRHCEMPVSNFPPREHRDGLEF